VVVTFNTDDPGYFSTTLTDELLLARDLLDLDEDALRSLQVVAVETSFAPPEMKRKICAEIEELSGT
jgi:adenosine deaminase